MIAAWTAGATEMERRRMREPLPSGARAADRLSAERLMADVRALSAPEMAGRRTGTDGGRRARTFVASRFAQLGLEDLAPGYLHPFTFEHRSVRALWRRDRPFRLTFGDAANVIARATGRERGPALLVSAHYDHLGVREGQVYAGADDNASGVATVLELARYFRDHPPRRAVYFAAFDAEELGLRGSRAFVRAKRSPVSSLALALNLDMISRSDEGRLVVAGTGPQPELIPLVRAAASHSPVRVHLGHDRAFLRAGLVEDWTTSSDQAPLADRGVPWLYFGVPDHADYHRPTDTAEKIRPAFLHDVAELALDTLLGADARDAATLASR